MRFCADPRSKEVRSLCLSILWVSTLDCRQSRSYSLGRKVGLTDTWLSDRSCGVPMKRDIGNLPARPTGLGNIRTPSFCLVSEHLPTKEQARNSGWRSLSRQE